MHGYPGFITDRQYKLQMRIHFCQSLVISPRIIKQKSIGQGRRCYVFCVTQYRPTLGQKLYHVLWKIEMLKISFTEIWLIHGYLYSNIYR